MVWFGTGLVLESQNPSNKDATKATLDRLSPAAQWDGTAGSGFSALPTDPTRTTAKPAVRPLFYPQRYDSSLVVGALAMAIDSGSLFNTLGIREVRFHYEGNTVTVTQPKWQAIPTLRGQRLYYGWWVNLQKEIGRIGDADLYIEAIPRDGTMQSRVIGPFAMDPVDDIYTHSITVEPSLSEIAGQRYQTLDAAAAFLNGEEAINPLVTLAEAGEYDLTVSSGNNLDDLRGYLNITAGTSGVTLAKPGFVGDLANELQRARYKLRLFGTDLGLDMRYITEVQGSSTDVGNNHVLDGIEVFTSGPDGAGTLMRGNIPARSTCVRSFPYATEVDFHDVRNP
ncbi:MAG: hypothetical protein SXU28_11190, partial [Pseudomonadota bacterium]|nr:hypothetical protein [Pseudomonadota bacterium]